MSNGKTDVEETIKRTEEFYDVKSELSEEELSKVSGGRGHLWVACAVGEHIKAANITC